QLVELVLAPGPHRPERGQVERLGADPVPGGEVADEVPGHRLLLLGGGRRVEPHRPGDAVDEQHVERLVDAPDPRDRQAVGAQGAVHLGVDLEPLEGARPVAEPPPGLEEERLGALGAPHVDEPAEPAAGRDLLDVDDRAVGDRLDPGRDGRVEGLGIAHRPIPYTLCPMSVPRILPPLTDVNRPYWTGGSDGRLLIERCRSCRRWQHPPTGTCESCGEPAAPEPVSGQGTVFTFTVNHQQYHPEVPPPYVIAIVELDEQPGLRLPTNLVGCDP